MAKIATHTEEDREALRMIRGMLQVAATNIFRECSTCRAKPGAPLLCGSCLHNRAVIGHLRQIAMKMSEYAETLLEEESE